MSNRTFIVIGGTKGIGRGVVNQLLAHGANVVFTACRQESSDENGAKMNAAISGHGQAAVGVPCRVDDFDAQEQVIETALDRFGRIDGFVANAAYTGKSQGASKTMPEDEAVKILRVNVFGILRFYHRLKPHLEANGGGIVFVTSISAFSASPPVLVYAASKAGMTNMAQSLAGEFAPARIRVNCVAPGLIRTPSSAQVWKDPGRLAQAERGIPLGRIGKPNDIGATCVFLLSDAGSYVTGQTLCVDGGRIGIGPPIGRDLSKT